MMIKLPRGEDELRDLAQRWLDVSTCPQQLFWGHIGAIDGWFPRTEMPRGVSNQADYFSGHYQAYGLNIQAMCDPDLRPSPDFRLCGPAETLIAVEGTSAATLLVRAAHPTAGA